jgi:uridine phosphorylase
MKFFCNDSHSLVHPRAMVEFFAASNARDSQGLFLKELALITFTPGDLRKLTQGQGVRKNEAWGKRNNRMYEGEGWIATQSPFGAPNAVMLLEELIAFGVRRAVFLGYCGSLQKGMEVGEIIVPMEAVREEGTSYHYLPAGEHSLPDRFLQQQMAGWMQGLDARVHTGKIWTTDAPYRETLTKVDRYRSEGVLGVEMEMSAVFALGMARGISVGAILLVSDCLSETGWDIGFYSPALKSASERVIRILQSHVQEMVFLRATTSV